MISDSKIVQVGVLKYNIIFNMNSCFGDISMIDLFKVKEYEAKIETIIKNQQCVQHSISSVTLLPPIPKPNSLRDAYAFRQHVSTSRTNRGLKMIPEFDEFPVFYFSNQNTIYADNEKIELMPDHFEKLDYELELAIVIGKGGKNILTKDADKHIAGFCIFNDISCRRLQMEEMKLNLGPAKGKDFASVLGPYLVTPEEIISSCIETPFGNKYNLEMRCTVNGELLSEGNAVDMNWTFAEIIERASYGVELYPGDIIGSGTVGTGCLLELNGTEKIKNPNYCEKWLKEGDTVEMEVERLGKITNKLVKSKSTHSILKLKK
jgi:fumarylacetoacetate (FAA) hydrolase